jgi:thymidylate kinase
MKDIEFMGMPKAGKTTAIEIVESYLKKKGKKVRVIYEGARISPLDKRDRFYYNAWSFHNTINRILESRLDHYDFILIDRGVYDHLAFADSVKAFCKENSFLASSVYYELFGSLEDFILVYLLNPKDAIQRERKHNPFLGRIFSGDFLEVLYASYNSLINQFKDDKRFYVFDGGKTLEDSTLEIICFLDKTLF